MQKFIALFNCHIYENAFKFPSFKNCYIKFALEESKLVETEIEYVYLL